MLKDRSMKKLFIFMLVIFMAFSSQVFAATEQASDSAAVSEDKKEEVHEVARVEVTGSRLAEDISEVPAPAYVITREEIEMSGARSTQEILDRMPGVNGLRNSSASALDKSVVVRGLTSEVLLLVDGIPFMTSSYGTDSMGSPFDLRTVPLESIERIEVVKGASSAVYGSNAAGGVINIITKKGIEESGGTMLLEGGSHGWFRGSFRGTAVLSDDVKISAGYTKTQENSEVNIRKRPNGIYDKATDYRGNDFVFGVEKGKWSFLSQVGDYESEWNNSDFGPTDYSQKNNYRRFQLNYVDETNTGRIYYNENSKDYSIVNTETFNKYKDSTIGATYSHKQEIFGVAGVWGIDWRRENSEFEGGAGNIPYDLSRNGFAPYVEMSVPVGEAQLDLGLRYEYWQVDDGENVNEFIPRVSLNWESPSGKLWYATAGRFFAMPSFYQIFLPMADEDWGPWGKYVNLRNPDLKSEKGWTYDIGVKDQKAKNPWSLGVFYINMEDKIYYSSEYDSITNTTTSQYINLNEYRAWGVEGEIKFNFKENWSYTQGISWTDADEKAEGADNWTRSGMPRLDLNGRLNYAKGPWAAELNAHYYGDRNIGGVNFNNDNDNIFIMNASVSWKAETHKVVLSCTNIFDKEFVLDSEGYINPERKIILSWQYEF